MGIEASLLLVLVLGEVVKGLLGVGRNYCACACSCLAVHGGRLKGEGVWLHARGRGTTVLVPGGGCCKGVQQGQ